MLHYILHRINILKHANINKPFQQQRQRWLKESHYLAVEIAADMLPVTIQSRAVSGATYQSIAFFQRRIAI